MGNNSADFGDSWVNFQRLRRIKDRLKEMNQWWNEVMSEQEDEEENRDTKKVRNGSKFRHCSFLEFGILK